MQREERSRWGWMDWVTRTNVSLSHVETHGWMGIDGWGWMHGLPGPVVSFDFFHLLRNSRQWTTAAHEEGEWRKTAEQGAERFMAKWIAAEKAGLDYGMQCVCVVIWTSDLWMQQPGSHRRKVTQDFSAFLLRCLPSFFIARRTQPSLSLVDREVEFCVSTN